ncbi:hypothetical protein WMF38_29065 [Sorangium sp. So ce118]
MSPLVLDARLRESGAVLLEMADLDERRPQLERRSAQDSIRTLAFAASGEKIWLPASRFALLEATSAIGSTSPTLTRQWHETGRRLLALYDARRITS